MITKEQLQEWDDDLWNLQYEVNEVLSSIPLIRNEFVNKLQLLRQKFHAAKDDLLQAELNEAMKREGLPPP